MELRGGGGRGCEARDHKARQVPSQHLVQREREPRASKETKWRQNVEQVLQRAIPARQCARVCGRRDCALACACFSTAARPLSVESGVRIRIAGGDRQKPPFLPDRSLQTAVVNCRMATAAGATARRWCRPSSCRRHRARSTSATAVGLCRSRQRRSFQHDGGVHATEFASANTNNQRLRDGLFARRQTSAVACPRLRTRINSGMGRIPAQARLSASPRAAAAARHAAAAASSAAAAVSSSPSACVSANSAASCRLTWGGGRLSGRHTWVQLRAHLNEVSPASRICISSLAYLPRFGHRLLSS